VGNHSTLGDLAVQVIDHIDPSKTPQILFHHYSLPNFDAGKRPQLESGLSIKSGKLRVPDGTLLLSKLNPASPKVWRIAKAMGQHAIASTEFLVLQPRAGVTLNALYAACLNPSFLQSIAAKATGTSSSHQRVRPSDLLATNLHLGVNNADLAEIGDFISAIDDKIELNRRMNATLEGMARALFQSWFVDFDPVHAKAEGRQPVGMDAETAALFPDSFEDSVLGPIPKGWEIRPLDEIAHFLNGLALQKFPVWGSTSLPVIKIAQLNNGHDTTRADRCSDNIPQDYVVRDGDVLFSWSGSLEVEVWTGGDGALNQHLFKVSSPTYPKWFYYLWTVSHLENFRSIAAGKATTMGHIQRKHLSDAKVFVPPSTLLMKIGEILSPLVESNTARKLHAKDLERLRDTLLPKLLSGELRVGGVAA
jgi:type I restriction enzyme S subunit